MLESLSLQLTEAQVDIIDTRDNQTYSVHTGNYRRVTGIGRAIALEFLRQGAAVTVNFLDDAGSRANFNSLKAEAPNETKLLGVGGDIGMRNTGQTLVEAAVQNGGRLDIFVANAGVSEFCDFLTY